MQHFPCVPTLHLQAHAVDERSALSLRAVESASGASQQSPLPSAVAVSDWLQVSGLAGELTVHCSTAPQSQHSDAQLVAALKGRLDACTHTHTAATCVRLVALAPRCHCQPPPVLSTSSSARPSVACLPSLAVCCAVSCALPRSLPPSLPLCAAPLVTASVVLQGTSAACRLQGRLRTSHTATSRSPHTHSHYHPLRSADECSRPPRTVRVSCRVASQACPASGR